MYPTSPTVIREKKTATTKTAGETFDLAPLSGVGTDGAAGTAVGLDDNVTCCVLRVVVDELKLEVEMRLVVDAVCDIFVVIGRIGLIDELIVIRGTAGSAVVLGAGGGTETGALLSVTGGFVVVIDSGACAGADDGAGDGAGDKAGAGAGVGVGVCVGESVFGGSVETGESTIVEEGGAEVVVWPRRLSAKLSIDEKKPLACSACSSRFATIPEAMARMTKRQLRRMTSRV